MKTIAIPDAISELDGDGASAFVDEGDDVETTLIITPNQWGSETRDGRVALVMFEGENACGFQVHKDQVEDLVSALRLAAESSH
jgi:hypothetical protein